MCIRDRIKSPRTARPCIRPSPKTAHDTRDDCLARSLDAMYGGLADAVLAAVAAAAEVQQGGGAPGVGGAQLRGPQCIGWGRPGLGNSWWWPPALRRRERAAALYLRVSRRTRLARAGFAAWVEAHRRRARRTLPQD